MFATARARDLVEDLPLSRERRAWLRELWVRERALPGVGPDPAARARLLRGAEGAAALELARAWAAVGGAAADGLEELAAWRSTAVLEVAPLLAARDLIEVGVAPGPRLGELLARLEDAQLRGEVGDRDGALSRVRRWLAEG